MVLYERAPAKINLTLHVLRRRADGFHDLESLVAFARFGDVLALDADAPPGLVVTGAHAAATGAMQDNLVLKAERALQAGIAGLHTGAFALTKSLPAAAGLGGGSADAAAALRLLARCNHLPLGDPRLRQAAAQVGSDVLACLDSVARMMRGRGEYLSPPLKLPPLFAVLVNPRRALETKLVFARMGLEPGEDYGFGAHPKIADALDFGALIGQLKRARNDMEDAASVLEPLIPHVLAVLSGARGCRLARMSGSGATCFGLFETWRAASKAARVIRGDRPEWWTKACALA